ncbi:MAG: hypothetical protein VKP62_12740 [Candidatus Sericytochromatia bacterium]|nr:hypothetical protein [Candidatus Sericytochromatia bacterium]
MHEIVIWRIALADRQTPPEPLFERPLYGPHHRLVGTIRNALADPLDGTLTALQLETSAGDTCHLPLREGLSWQGTGWFLPTSWELKDPHEEDSGITKRENGDYMIGQAARVTLSDFRGHPIVRAGQPITALVIELAQRAGVLHRLEAVADLPSDHRPEVS